MSLSDDPIVPDFGKETPPASPKKDAINEILSFFKTLIVFLVIAFFLRASIVEAYKIPSGSMIPTLRIGDHILVNKLSYGFRLPYGVAFPFRVLDTMIWQYDQPGRGDVVVFTRPDEVDTDEDESEINIIKRVVGIPGDVVEVRGSSLYLNGQVQEETYARWLENGIPEGDFGPERVPAGTVLLMGDNRDHSRDSRFWSYPFLDQSRIKGRAFVIYWSWDSLKRIFNIIR
jgi:signal peptidase I